MTVSRTIRLLMAIAATALLAVALLAAPVSADDETGVIAGFTFSPATYQISVGDTITVTNNDGVPHTFTADDGSFDASVPPDASASVTFEKEGSIPFHCEIHPSMTGRIVVSGTPAELKKAIGGDVIAMESADPEASAGKVRAKFGGEPAVVDGTVRLERAEGHRFIPQLAEAFPGLIRSITLGKPTLEDVFIHETGHKFWREGDA